MDDMVVLATFRRSLNKLQRIPKQLRADQDSSLLKIQYQLIFTLLLFIGLIGSSYANEPANPHEHQGKLKAYQGEPPKIALTDLEKQTLEESGGIYKKIDDKGTQRGIAVFRVHARASTIWSVIKNFSSYPAWIKDIEETQIYQKSDTTTYVKFVSRTPLGGEVSWYIAHDYPKDQREWGIWQLDYRYLSDIDDSVGFWRVVPVANKPHLSDVYYSSDLKLKGFLSSLFETFILDQGLQDATQWVQLQSEALEAKMQADQAEKLSQ